MREWSHEQVHQVFLRSASARCTWRRSAAASTPRCGGRGGVDGAEDRLHAATLLGWIQRHDIDTGIRHGATTAEAWRVKELEREVKELRRANEIPKPASALFVQAELDRRHKS